MMVTFVSQCEKKALNKTRRVLDAFANRIGNRTWQTVITNEGLQAVKKLLRKTASKNTAVSCHWLRSRSRSELKWVVGNSEKFNSQGIVPVNYTNDKIIIGEIEVDIEKIFANTKAQRLDHHLFAVAFLAYSLVKRLAPNDAHLAKAVFIAGLWHDIGKIDPAFQNWLNKLLKKKAYEEVPDEGQHIDKGKFSWKKHPRHNELSLIYFELLADIQGSNPESLERARHAIFWHHAKPIRDKNNEIKRPIDIFNKMQDFENLYPVFTSSILGLMKSVDSICDSFMEESPVSLNHLNLLKVSDIEESLERIVQLPKYKRYSSKQNLRQFQGNIQNNAKNNIVRAALITADRLISQLSADALEQHINNQSLLNILDDKLQKDRGLQQHIQNCLDEFKLKYPSSDRNKQQMLAAKDLSDDEIEIAVLRGPAGCGKTKIALEWAYNTKARKIYWICPRVQVCEGLFKDLTSKEYLPNAEVEICTGEIKQKLVDGKPVDTPAGEEFSADVVITTIDQIVNSITTHRGIETFTDFMNAHVVFDEYHEYIQMSGFNLLFAELVEAKKQQQDDEDTLPNTLLVSATPNPLFVTDVLDLREGDIVNIDSFNKSRYQLIFREYDEKAEDDSNPLYQLQSSNSFVISNTAITAQKSFIDNQNRENGLLIHSKFKPGDRKILFDRVYETFKENGDQKYDVLRSGPIIQASLNITCDNMVSEMTHAENLLQRMGRLDRFGKNHGINQYTIAITRDVKEGKSKGASSRFLGSLHSLQSSKAWYEFLSNELPEAPSTIDEIYAIYDRFYQDGTCRSLVEQDLIAALKESVLRIGNNLLDPVTLPSIKKDTQKIKIKKHSLRGDSRFVQMAVCKVESRRVFDQLSIYAYEDDEYEDESFTYSVDSITGYGVGVKNLLAFMAKKHHNIKTNTKKIYKDIQLLNEARNPETPIYLSYTPDDLKLVASKPNPYAIYYAQGKNQPIGAISLKQLTNEGE